MKGLSECKASNSNIRGIQVKDIVKEDKDHLETYSSARIDISWINDLIKGKSEKGKIDKGKSEKGLIAGSFNWDEESVSLEDEGTTRIRAFIAIAEDEPSVIDMLKSGQRQSKTDKIGHENRMSAKKDAAEGKFILSPNQI
nr:hypothetical protein [Tanacetum cinerariifolium]